MPLIVRFCADRSLRERQESVQIVEFYIKYRGQPTTKNRHNFAQNRILVLDSKNLEEHGIYIFFLSVISSPETNIRINFARMHTSFSNSIFLFAVMPGN